ncbi:hypothetical protein SK128_011576 [Halocaridina rubra]|uniref:Uncharacterized protein n=1 Tax=Halocaridina rubra TaxID=373956 RepID=A0AAN8WXL7_HALRR
MKERKIFRKKLLEASESMKSVHPFKNIYPWKTRKELAIQMKNSEVYNKGGLIALCKPYGIAQFTAEGRGHDGEKTIVQLLNSGGVPAETPVLASILPLLKDMYEVDHLEIVKTCERWNSGLVLLSTKPSLKDKIQKCFRRSKAFKKPALTFNVITNGIPITSSGSTKVAITLENVPNIGKVPMIKKSCSTREIEHGASKVVIVKHSTVAENEDLQVALVEVNIQTLKWHCLRVWLAHNYCPVLGDSLYGGRVTSIAGKRVQINPHNLKAYQPQDISSDVLSRLHLPETSLELIPSFIHLSKITLSHFNRDKSDLVITAPPPEYFNWTCEQLGLIFPQVASIESNSPKRVIS